MPKRKTDAKDLPKPSTKPASKLHKHVEGALKQSMSLLQATLESTADGILVVDKSGKITSYNRQFAEMWRIPDEIVASRDDNLALNHVLEQLKDPNTFISKVRELYAHPDDSSFDVLEFRDGKIFERYSQAQRVDGVPVGRVWSFRDVTLCKKAEQEIRLLAQAIASTQDCVSITDLEEKIIFVNEAFLKTYGYTSEELLGQNISFVRPVKTSLETGNQILTATFAGGWSGEVFNLRKDGTEFPIELWTSVVKNDVGKVIAMVGVARDITQHKRDEEALRENEEKFRYAFENASIGMSMIRPDGQYLAVNPALCKILGYSKEELLTGTINRITYPDDIERGNKWIKKMISGDRSEPEFEKRYIHKNGHIVWCLLRAEWIKDYVGNPKMSVVHIMDITQRRQAEEALRVSEQHNKIITKMTTDYVFVVDVDYQQNLKLRWISENLVQVTGRSIDDITTPDLWKHIIHAKDVVDFFEFIERVLTTKKPGDLECRSITKFGTERWIHIFAKPETDKQNRVVTIIGAIKDITEHKRAEEALRESEERYRQLIETMQDGIYRSSHEGKFLEVNPAMVKILGYSSKEELMAIDIKKQLYFDPDDRESAALEEKLVEIAVFRLRKKDGSEVWVEDHGRHVLDENGNILDHEGVLRDVTERKLAEDALEKSTREHEKLIQELRFALDNVKTLQGLIPICASCKKIRDDKGYWNQVEGYIMEHSDATFTHGVCPDCAKKLYEEL